MGTTPKGFPYPEDTDLVSQGAQAIKALALAIDTNVGRVAGGTANVNIAAANTAASVAVTFPAGRFTAAPNVTAVPQTASPAGGFANTWVNSVTATGFAINHSRSSGSGNVTHQWIAVQT
jgi:hypothetical protein